MVHPNEKPTHSGCGGCGCLAAPFLPIPLVFGTMWPIGYLFRCGEFAINEKGNSTFTFFPGYGGVPFALTLLFIIKVVILYKVLDRFFTGQKTEPHALLLELTQALEGAESWRKILDNDEKQVLLEYHSEREVKQARELWPVIAGVFCALFTPLIVATPVYLFSSPEKMPAVGSLAAMILLYWLAGWLIAKAFRIKAGHHEIDDRLIVDFDKNEVQKIALHDRQAKPESWFGFGQIRKATLTKGKRHGEIRYSTLCLETEAREKEFSLFTNSSGDWEDLARELCFRFNTQLEIEVYEIRKSI